MKTKCHSMPLAALPANTPKPNPCHKKGTMKTKFTPRKTCFSTDPVHDWIGTLAIKNSVPGLGRILPSFFRPGRGARLGLAGLGLCLLLGLPSARVADFHVATAQDLQNALFQSANNGANNTIYITNGYYLDTGSFHYASSDTNSLTLQAEPGVASSAISLDSGGTGSALTITSTNCQITVQGMTFIRNCGDYSLGALQIAAPGSEILVKGCEFLSPTNTSGVGLLITAGKDATVDNCIATGTTNGINGIESTGISIIGVTTNVVVENCTITTNGNNYFSYINNPAGLYVSGADSIYVPNTALVLITNCLFTGNSAYYFGGGACLESVINVVLSGNTFTGNQLNNGVNSDGGGVYCNGLGGGMTLVNNTFTGNSASSQGGGFACNEGTNLTMIGNRFVGNFSDASQIYGGVAYGGGAYCTGISGNISLTNNVFINNSAVNSFSAINTSAGGGFSCSSSVTNLVSLFGNKFQNNSANAGGGLYVSAPNINLLNNLAVNNVVTNWGYGYIAFGGGIWVDASATLNMINNTVAGNTSGGNGGGAAFVIGGVVEYLNIYNNIIWGNSATNGGDVYVNGTGKQKIFSYNDMHSQAGPQWDLALDNIDAAPQFSDPINGDYHIQKSSPCIAAGWTNAPALPATDLDGNPRVVNGTVDMGCYEFIASITPPAMAITTAGNSLSPGRRMPLVMCCNRSAVCLGAGAMSPVE
jgi:hypothetical protein